MQVAASTLCNKQFASINDLLETSSQAVFISSLSGKFLSRVASGIKLLLLNMDTKKRSWSKEETYALIQMYEGFPELWNVKSKMYRDRIKKEKAFKAIADKFKASVSEIQRKLHNLRTQQNQECKKIKKRHSEEGADDVYKSSWEYFDALKFLFNDEISMAQGEDNLVSNKMYFELLNVFIVVLEVHYLHSN